MTYTREHLNITYGTMPWGAPTALVQVVYPDAPHYGHTLWQLSSTQGMDTPGGKMPSDSHYLLHRLDGHRRRIDPEGDPNAPCDPNRFMGGDWHGSYPSGDLETCIDFLVESLNEWELEEDDRWRVADTIYHLRNLLSEFGDIETAKSTKAIRDRWSEVRQAFLTAEMTLFRRQDQAAMGGTEGDENG